AIEALVKGGVSEMMLLTRGTHAGEFLRLLGNGDEFGIHRLLYAYQDKPGGIAKALRLAEKFVGGERAAVLLGDNILELRIRLVKKIEGVVLKELVTHEDERGFFREIIRETDDFFDHFGQWSHSLMYPGTAKAWHIHKQQADWWYVIGALKVALYDTRDGSATKGALMEFLM